jgi:hypothetical protein
MPSISDGGESDRSPRGAIFNGPAAKGKSATWPFRPSRVSTDQAFEQGMGPISDEDPSLISKTRPGLASMALALAVAFLSVVGAGSAQPQIYSAILLSRCARRGLAPIPLSIPRAASMALPAKGGTLFYGTTFKPDAAGQKTILYSCLRGCGQYPTAGLIRDPEGNLYETTFGAELTTKEPFSSCARTGRATVLRSFNKKNGEWPAAGLVMGELGNLYGTTE